MEAVIFIGLQASGKSSFYKEKFFNSHVRVSMDLLNTRNREQKLLLFCIDTEARLVVDNTNPLKSDRAKYISLLKEAGYKISGYYFSSSIKDCLERNSKRIENEVVPEKGVLATYSKMKLPSLEEGYDQLFFVSLGKEGFQVSEWEDEI